jgi:hypothetical protein
MLSSRLIASVLLIFSGAIAVASQTKSEKLANASVSGKVTLKNKAVAGVRVFAEEQNPKIGTRTGYRATTDQNGNYRITNLPAGTYFIRPLAPSFTLEDEYTSNTIIVSESEAVEDINFALVPGGVITGKISDADGKPLIEEPVTIMPLNTSIVEGGVEGGDLRTDDRGIYRAFGLPAGKYKVSVGQNESLPSGGRPPYRQTFYPSVTEYEKGAVIELTEGSEARNIDIVVGRAVTTFKVSGRVLDKETGKPLSNIKYGVYQRRGEYGGSSIVGQSVTNADGEFRLENVVPGAYVVFIVSEDSGVRGDSVSFEVVDRDVSDLVINAGKAASLSGVVVFENADGSSATGKFNDLYVHAFVESDMHFYGAGASQAVNPDGSFKVLGLRKGAVRFNLMSRSRFDLKPIEVVRIERDGAVLPGGLVLNDGEQVTGIRLVIKYLTGAIHGQIKIEGDEVIPSQRLTVWVTRIDPNRPEHEFSNGNSAPQVDSRKRFVADGLAAGTYVVSVAVFDANRQDSQRIFKQDVTVSDNAVSEVTITIKNKP